jgi:hypothetical protein
MNVRWMLAAVLAPLLLAGCANDPTRGKERALRDTLRSYASTLRWGDIAQAQVYLDPEYLEKHPLSDVDLARYRQVQVSQYSEHPAVPVSDTQIQQIVEIGLINVHTQNVRTIVDRQTWRYDAKQKRWWLTSGLPDITRRD